MVNWYIYKPQKIGKRWEVVEFCEAGHTTLAYAQTEEEAEILCQEYRERLYQEELSEA